MRTVSNYEIRNLKHRHDAEPARRALGPEGGVGEEWEYGSDGTPEMRVNQWK